MLSKRELEIAKLAHQGKGNLWIANTLGIKLQTVKNHLYAVYSKHGIRNRRELGIVLAVESAMEAVSVPGTDPQLTQP